MDEPPDSGSGHSPSSSEILQSFIPHPYQSLNAAGEIIAVNEAWLDLLAYDRDDVLGQWFGEFLTGDSRTMFEARFEEFKSSGELSDVELELTSGNDDTIVVSFDGVIEYDDQGDFVRTHCQFTDITDRKHRKASFRSSSDVIMLLDEQGRARYVSPSVEQVLGYDPEELRGRTAFEDIHPDDRERAMEVFSEAVENPGTVVTAQYRVVDADGAWRWVEGRGKSLLDELDMEAVIINSRVIDERKEYERKLEQQEFLFSRVQEIANIGIWEYDPQTDELTWSDGVRRIHGVDAEYEPTIEEALSFYHPDDRETITSAVTRAIEDGQEYDLELRIIRADDEVRYVRALGEVSTDENGETDLVRGVFQDITERKEREQELAEERNKYSALVEQSHDGVGLVQDKEFVFVNDRLAEITGYEEHELLGMPLTELIAPEYQQLVLDRYEQRLDPDADSPPSQYTLTYETKDGRKRVTEISIATIQYEGAPAVLVSVRDVTERQRYEAKLEEQRDNLEILNQVVRHDIRNDMMAVQGRARLLEEHIEPGDAAWDDLHAIQESTENAIQLTKTARDLAETMLSTEDDVEAVRLDQHLDSAVENARSTHDNGIVIVDEAIPEAKVAGNELLEAVFRNLIQNAVVHNDKDVPEVHISTSSDAETLTVAIADNGPGIPDDQKAEIFGKGEKALDSPGTGVGLYLVKTLVEQYGGDVWVEDNDPEGSVFVVELPRR